MILSIDLSEQKMPLSPDMGLDIRVLARGYFRLGMEFTRSLLAHGQRVTVRHARYVEDRMDIWSEIHLGYSIEIVWTGCNYGGGRPWFVCPECDRRCAILYSPIENFVCRTCAGLYYETPQMNAGDRAAMRAKKLKKQLGWTAGGILGAYGPKPVGMHWKTFERLRLAYKAAEQEVLWDIEMAAGIRRVDIDATGRLVGLPVRAPRGRPRRKSYF